MERAVPILPADDLSVARAFYEGALRFRVEWAFTEDGRTGLLGVARGGIALTIDAPMAGHGRQACVSLHVDSADAYYEEWRDKVPAVTPVKDESWGARTFGVTDPSGNTLFVIGPSRADLAGRAAQVRALVPLAHVASVSRSIEFYERLGFGVGQTHAPEAALEPVWAWLRSGDAHVMLARATDAVDAGPAAVLFYLYVPDVAGFRQRLVDAGLTPGPIEFPFYSPRGEFRVSDPDGCVLIVAHT